MKRISAKLCENREYFLSLFKDDADFVYRDFDINGTQAMIMCFDGLANKHNVSINVLYPILHAPLISGDGELKMRFIETDVLTSFDQKREEETGKITEKMMSGFSVLMLDGCPWAMTFGMQGFEKRGLSEPQNEVMQHGAKDGFSESLQSNMALIRRRLKSTRLRFEKLTVGNVSRTSVVLCYMQDAANPRVLKNIRSRIEECNLETLLGGGYLQSYLEENAIFATLGNSERPDTICGKIKEGRVAVMVDGSPGVIYAPFLFVENFQLMDDYLIRPFYATFIRLLKFASFFITIFLPGLYVAVTSNHPEMLPKNLMLKIAEEQAKTPFPVMVESIMLYFMYQIMREAGLRVPRILSNTVSILGALVIGDTAVSAGIVSAPSLLVIAMTAISSYVVPNLYEPLSLLRLAFIVVGAVLGMWGIMLGFVFLTLNLCASDSFGVPSLSPLSPFDGRLSFRDVLIRRSWRKLSKKTAYVQDMPGSSAGKADK